MSMPLEDSTTKRRRIQDSASPSEAQRKASCSKLPGELCGHCNKECPADGEAIQCDLCCVWVHAECEGVSTEQYEKLSGIASTKAVADGPVGQVLAGPVSECNKNILIISITMLT